ncbi:hypothetical protein F5Y16DRAFT_365249 [Xylariaceae sp. FL0255]|nr:hypothetical protein F5Y16DRAFT_365249 [Xylariaceae sp. FL0255]
MASLLPRTKMLSRSIPISSTPSCTTRLFSSTPISSRLPIPPESPLYINVPNPPQDQSIESLRDLKPVKGFLPKPRLLFNRKGAHLKITDTYLSRSSPLPTSKRATTSEPASEIQAWKRKMAVNRRANMRAGIEGLWSRKQKTDSIRAARTAAKVAAHRAAAMAPEREDERLTRSTVNAQTLATKVLLDPERFTRALESRARHEAIESRKSSARRDAIQTLYMNARSFIVSEAALDAHIETEFAADKFTRWGTNNDLTPVSNIWDVNGPPLSVAGMMKDLDRTTPDLLKGYTGDDVRTTSRQKVVAEELTGGKMD